MLDREQEQLSTGNAPSALMTVKVGAKKDGTITAVHYKSWGSAGVAGGAGTQGPVSALHGKNPNLKVESYDVYTNAGPAAPLRGSSPSGGHSMSEGLRSSLPERPLPGWFRVPGGLSRRSASIFPFASRSCSRWLFSAAAGRMRSIP